MSRRSGRGEANFIDEFISNLLIADLSSETLSWLIFDVTRVIWDSVFDWLFTDLVTNQRIRYKRDWNDCATNERPRTWNSLIVYSSLEAVATALTKLNVLGVKLQVIEVKKLEFDIHFTKYSWKYQIDFHQKCNQQLIDSCPGPFWPFCGENFRNSNILQEMW